MKTASVGAARRYARALLDVAREKGEATALRKQLTEAGSLFETHAELKRLLTHPALGPEKKQTLVGAVFAEPHASELLRRLLALLAERDRLALLPAIAQAYTAQWNAANNVAAADVVTATPLAAEQLAAIEAALKQATGMGIEIKASLEPALLGGVLVKIAGRHLDGSVRGRLAALRERLTGAHGSL